MANKKDTYKITVSVENCSSKDSVEIIREAYEKFLFQIAKKLFIDMDIDMDIEDENTLSQTPNA